MGLVARLSQDFRLSAGLPGHLVTGWLVVTEAQPAWQGAGRLHDTGSMCLREGEERRGGWRGCWAAWLTKVLLYFRRPLSACRTRTMSSVPPRTLSKMHYYPHFATPITEA